MKSDDSKLIEVIIEGYNYIYKPKESTNPYALTEIIEKPESYYDISPLTVHQMSILTDDAEKIMAGVAKKFNISVENVKDHYKLFHQDMPIYDYLEKIKNLTQWHTDGYYDNDKDEYYGKCPKGYETPMDNKYRDNNLSGAHGF